MVEDLSGGGSRREGLHLFEECSHFGKNCVSNHQVLSEIFQTGQCSCERSACCKSSHNHVEDGRSCFQIAKKLVSNRHSGRGDW